MESRLEESIERNERGSRRSSVKCEGEERVHIEIINVRQAGKEPGPRKSCSGLDRAAHQCFIFKADADNNRRALCQGWAVQFALECP